MNPVLAQLGYGPNDRVAIVHADDVGMCHAATAAFADLIEFGLVTSGSVMVPCAWFPAAAAYCRANPQADVGVHVTLTCEWDAYRWGPLSTRERASGLLDDEGYFPRASSDVWERADADAVWRETVAQLDAAMAAGIDVTHLDDHMAASAHPRFFPRFVELAIARRLPLRALRPAGPPADEGEWQRVHRESLLRVQEVGLPLFDAIGGLPLDDPTEPVAQARALFDRLPPGLSLIVLHPALDTPELRAIARDWPSRVAHYTAFTSRELRQYVRESGIHLISFRDIRNAEVQRCVS